MCRKGCFVVTRAIFVRVLFAIHGLASIWRLYVETWDLRYWYITLALAGLLIETIVTLHKKRGNEWKWFCPSVFFYLLCVVPAVWFLELHQLDQRIRKQGNEFNDTSDININGTDTKAIFVLEQIKLTSDQWVRSLEQILLLFLIIGRWLLPKGKLTHDQLSQLLLVYIGTAADIVEFFEAFKEKEVRYNRLLCQVILGIWSWSLLQFAMVLTATKARKDQSGVFSKVPVSTQHSCCTPDVYGIIISIFLQDAPFLVLRMLLIFKYGVLSYTNMFFTCKNTLVIMLLLYRLAVVQMGRRKRSSTGGATAEYVDMSESSSRVRLMPNSHSADTYYPYKSKVSLKEDPDEEDATAEPEVKYVIRRHLDPEDFDVTQREANHMHATLASAVDLDSMAINDSSTVDLAGSEEEIQPTACLKRDSIYDNMDDVKL